MDLYEGLSWAGFHEPAPDGAPSLPNTSRVCIYKSLTWQPAQPPFPGHQWSIRPCEPLSSPNFRVMFATTELWALLFVSFCFLTFSSAEITHLSSASPSEWTCYDVVCHKVRNHSQVTGRRQTTAPEPETGSRQQNRGQSEHQNKGQNGL